MKVFNLGKPDGTFETGNIGNNCRQFGFPTVLVPEIGDLVVIQRPAGKVLYRIESVDKNATPRYEDLPEYKFYTGHMVDVIATKQLTNEIVSTLKVANLA